MRRRRAAAEQLPCEVLERFLLSVAQLLARRRVEAAAASSALPAEASRFSSSFTLSCFSSSSDANASTRSPFASASERTWSSCAWERLSAARASSASAAAVAAASRAAASRFAAGSRAVELGRELASLGLLLRESCGELLDHRRLSVEHALDQLGVVGALEADVLHRLGEHRLVHHRRARRRLRRRRLAVAAAIHQLEHAQ